MTKLPGERPGGLIADQRLAGGLLGNSSPKLRGEIHETKIRGIEDWVRQSIPSF